MNYYLRWPGDYARSTGDLSLIEHGALCLLLDHYYARGEPLPSDVDRLVRICRATSAEERRAVEFVADRFFPIAGDGQRHGDRCDKDIADWQERADRARQAGKKGGRPPKKPRDNPPGSPEKTRSEPTGFSPAIPEANPDGTQSESSPAPAPTPASSPAPAPAPAPITVRSMARIEPAGRSEPRTRDRWSAARFEELKAAFPKRNSSQRWGAVENCIRARLNEGYTWDQMVEGARRYHEQQWQAGNVGTEFVQSARTFFGRERSFLEEHKPGTDPARFRHQIDHYKRQQRKS